ncbi:MAG: carotenoid oxygenase family protein [Clostridia bacterium]|nr:carotenoid oxygenase family protein [Clostridia bacterium]
MDYSIFFISPRDFAFLREQIRQMLRYDQYGDYHKCVYYKYRTKTTHRQNSIIKYLIQSEQPCICIHVAYKFENDAYSDKDSVCYTDSFVIQLFIQQIKTASVKENDSNNKIYKKSGQQRYKRWSVCISKAAHSENNNGNI